MMRQPALVDEFVPCVAAVIDACDGKPILIRFLAASAFLAGSRRVSAQSGAIIGISFSPSNRQVCSPPDLAPPPHQPAYLYRPDFPNRFRRSSSGSGA